MASAEAGTAAVEFVRLDPAGAAEDDVRGVNAIEVAGASIDRPGTIPPSYGATAGFLESLGSGELPGTCWVARRDGDVVAYALLLLPRHENTELAILHIRVHPEVRGEGIGTAFLGVLLKEVRSQGRTRVSGLNVLGGGASEEWAVAQGFSPVWRYVIQQLPANADPMLWDVPVPDGYRLVEWTGSAPETLVASYAAARTAIKDAPLGVGTWEEPDWSPERVRAHEADLAAQGWEERVVAVVCEETGEVAGLTELLIRRTRPEIGIQRDTAVSRAHRGHGLGRCMKAAMMRRLVAERPDLVQVQTQTAVDNEHMIRVNHILGYATVRTMVDLEADLGELERWHGTGTGIG